VRPTGPLPLEGSGQRSRDNLVAIHLLAGKAPAAQAAFCLSVGYAVAIRRRTERSTVPISAFLPLPRRRNRHQAADRATPCRTRRTMPAGGFRLLQSRNCTSTHDRIVNSGKKVHMHRNPAPGRVALHDSCVIAHAGVTGIAIRPLVGWPRCLSPSGWHGQSKISIHPPVLVCPRRECSRGPLLCSQQVAMPRPDAPTAQLYFKLNSSILVVAIPRPGRVRETSEATTNCCSTRRFQSVNEERPRHATSVTSLLQSRNRGDAASTR
jgi:hypothetical protein